MIFQPPLPSSPFGGIFIANSQRMYARKPNPHGVGRKGDFRPEHIGQVYHLALLGARDADIALALGIKDCTLAYWKVQNEEFAEALRRGRLEADAKVAHALYHRAIGYSHKETQVVLNRVSEYDAQGKITRSYTEPVLIEVVKHYAPDSYAALKWLSLRRRDMGWSEAVQVQVQHSGQVDVAVLQGHLQDADQLTEEELRLALKLGIQRAVEAVGTASN